MKLVKLVWLLSWLTLPGAVGAQFAYTTNPDGGSVTIIGYTGPDGAVAIPSSFHGYAVTGIGQDAFDVFGVTSVTIPSSVTNIAGDAFYGCTSLASFSVSTNNPAYSSLNGVLFDRAQNFLVAYPESATRRAYAIPQQCDKHWGGCVLRLLQSGQYHHPWRRHQYRGGGV